MSFDTVERSNYGAKPIALYEFNVGTTFWRYSSDVEDVTISGNVYLGVGAEDDGMTQSGDAENDDVTIKLPSNAALASLFIGTPPSVEIWATIRRMQYGDNEAPVHWVGTVNSAKQDNSTVLNVLCKMLTASFNRNGLRLTWGRQCPYALYDKNCRVDKDDYGTAVQITALTGDRVTSPAIDALADGYFSNGFFEWNIAGDVQERRPIEGHVGDHFTVLGTTDGLVVGQWIVIYPGCQRTTLDCLEKFNNLSNYGGIPHLPGKSPFDGDPVF